MFDTCHTCAYHGDGRLDVDPFIRVDPGVDEYQTVEVGFLNATQSVLDGVVILRKQLTS